MRLRLFVACILGMLLPQLVFFATESVSAQVTELQRLQKEISERGDRLAEIESEIAQYESELQEVGAEKQTLQQAINQLELERKKVNAEISRTENLITSTNLEINKLSLEISRSRDDISKVETAIGVIIRNKQRSANQSLVELLLQHDRLSEFWGSLETQETIRDTMSEKVAELTSYKTLLEEQRDSSEAKRAELSSLKQQYNNQNQVLVTNREEKSQLLEITKNEELTYQELLADREAARDKILQELRSFESELQFFLDPNTIPPAGTTVFNWPLTNVIITQYFGGTEFAARNAAAYGGRAYHPGVDMGAPRGTPILAPLTGVVRATGNTDAVPGCFSWGKWTLIDHANGLSTLYAHQNVIAVSPGQKVSTGETIGYVGNTGFSTGPHLHFTVYAKDGVSVRKFSDIKTVTSCGAATTPVAATEAYIDPMLYLPPY